MLPFAPAQGQSAYYDTLLTPPVAEPVALSDLKAHLRIDTADDDTYLTGILTVAREECEKETNRAFLTQTWVRAWDRFPGTYWLELGKGKLQSVSSLTYYGTDNVGVVWPSSNYYADAMVEPARLVLTYGNVWPTAPLRYSSAVQVQYVCGWTAANLIPTAIKQAILLFAGHLYANREEVIVGDTAAVASSMIECGAKHLLSRHRIHYS